MQTWQTGSGEVVPLADNFRSREKLLEFVNSVCGALMNGELGGLVYNDQARLRFGSPDTRQALSATTDNAPCVELHLRLTQASHTEETEADAPDALADLADLAEADKEARLVALRLRELRDQQFPIWDEAHNAFRPVDWGDMAVLLRAPANKSDSYAKEFSRLKVPLLVARGGFYQSLEISDLLSLLQALDNPLQDWPVLAVLHSPLVGLTLDELATIRLAAGKVHFWTALVRWQDATKPETAHKVSALLGRFGRWRRLARQVSLSQCLENILAETHYADWLLTQPRGDQRYTQVQRLLGLARRFDQFQRQGLFRFLRFIEAQRLADTEPEVAPMPEENSVRLLSIHQSKGLEFPVVVVADLGKQFNRGDLRADVILDEQYGLCPQIKPPRTGVRYPSLPFWLARDRQLRELLGEELRLLYVAMTRARDRLILTANVPDSRYETLWTKTSETPASSLLSARSCADWLGAWFAQQPGAAGSQAGQGHNALLSWILHDDRALLEGIAGADTITVPQESVDAPPEVWERLSQRLAWKYPFAAATRQPAKTSVTRLQGRASGLDEEIAVWERREVSGGERRKRAEDRATESAAESGTAHHEFLRFVSLDLVDSPDHLKAEAQRLVEASALTRAQMALLDFGALAAFWRSDLGLQVRAHAQSVHRELPFTARFAPDELSGLGTSSTEASLEGEFVVVQGVADLVVVRPDHVWIIDFKTDSVGRDELPQRAKSYEPQLKLYARALGRSYRKPVSKCWLYFLKPGEAVEVNPG
jgi:ATP-dependent helicase/nuclease subunit A